MNKLKLEKIYNVAVALLALVSVGMAVADLLDAPISHQPLFAPIDTAILIVFAVDYVFRFIFAKNKWTFFKHNLFDLIAIIPFNSIFSVFRTLRIVRIARLSRLAKLSKLTKLVRLIRISGRFKQRAHTFLHMNGLIYIVYLNIASVALGSVAIYLLEKGTTVNTFPDAIWWAFVTATTVGYGDISPVTPGGRIIAAVLMIFGIGLVSMLTGTVATYFTQKANETAKQQKLAELKEVASTLDESQLASLLTFAAEQKKGTGDTENVSSNNNHCEAKGSELS